MCGIAFQWTTSYATWGKTKRGRVYLPQEDLDRFGYTAADLRAGVHDERFRRLMQYEIDANEKYYDEGAELVRWLDPEGRRVFGSMRAVYRALLAEIKRRDGDVLSARVRLSKWRKMRIATRWLLFGSSPAPVAGAPAP